MATTPSEKMSIVTSYLDFVFQGLWGHVDGGSWSLGHGGRSQSRHDAGHAEVRYLGRHAGVQEDVSGGQVAVDDGRTVAVQEGEAAGHVVQDGALQAQGEVGLGRRRRLRIQHVVEAGQELLHDQRWHSRAGQEAHAQELDDVRVAEGAHQLTLSHELARRPLDPFRRRSSGVLEEVVYFFGGAHGSGYGHLLHAAIGTRPYRGSRGPSVGQQKRAQLRLIAKKSLGSHH